MHIYTLTHPYDLYIRVRVCAYVHTRTCAHIHITRMHTLVNTCSMYTCVCTCTHARTHILSHYTNTHTFKHMQYAGVYVYTQRHTHTRYAHHTHTHVFEHIHTKCQGGVVYNEEGQLRQKNSLQNGTGTPTPMQHSSVYSRAFWCHTFAALFSRTLRYILGLFCAALLPHFSAALLYSKLCLALLCRTFLFFTFAALCFAALFYATLFSIFSGSFVCFARLFLVFCWDLLHVLQGSFAQIQIRTMRKALLFLDYD